MRLKKQVLLVSPSSEWLEMTGYILFVRGFQVTRSQTAEQLWGELQKRVFGVVVLHLPAAEVSPEAIQKMQPRVPICVIGNELAEDPFVNAYLGRNITTAELVDRLQILCARKRGPRSVSRAEALSEFEKRRLA